MCSINVITFRSIRSSASSDFDGPPLVLSSDNFVTRSSYFGRNSCSGRSSNLIVTGSPCILRKICMKSSFCKGFNFSRAWLRSSSVTARIISWTIGRRSSALNILSVLQSPMPSAPSTLAMAAPSGVSALLLTLRARMLSAQLNSCFASSLRSGSTVGTAPISTFPVVPSIVMISSFLTVTLPLTSSSLVVSIVIASHPTTAGLPIPRATTAA